MPESKLDMGDVIDHIESDSISSAPSSPHHSTSASTSTKPKADNEITSTTKTPQFGSPDRPGTMPPSGSRTPMAYLKSKTPKFLTPLGSPIRKAIHLTKFDPNDAWLPITESRNGNAYYAAFHTLCAGIGFQALVLPVAFTILGCVHITVIHYEFTSISDEDTQSGCATIDALQLAYAAFGEMLGRILTLFPIIGLSFGTCITCIIIGASTSKIFFQVACASSGCKPETLTVVEWYLVFACAAIILSQLPNLNSIAGISLIGAIAAVGYCTTIWTVSVTKDRLPNVSYNPIRIGSHATRFFDVLNAVGIIAFAFRGNNFLLEVQATIPSSKTHPSSVPMWNGIKVSYALIAACLFPLAIGGYWAYGLMLPPGGMLTALFVYHSQDLAKSVLGFTCILVIINVLSSFQIYAMPAFDEMESIYVKCFKKPCTWWLRMIIRTSFGFICFFGAVALPFIANLAGLIGGVSLPVTLAYPCFMWLIIKKPKVYSLHWWINWVLGVVGMILSGLLITAGFYVLIHDGVKLNFFKPT
ncbi:amino acid transporter, transmembrane domain-containing protein [Artemisia annua]|uniref:Amino acid transporter, transmembrane domain-containing protein n=1 Tax=Artemisia annua TaxID=35608 RepID=A0A2U1L1V7_ARTAN|nr:amino acid transporter, transmembrane domain-containing protein [Artemisia annua]